MVRPVLTPPTYVVVETRFVVPPLKFGEDPYTEIVVGQSHDADARRLVLVSRDTAIIARALLLEGSDQRVALTWHTEGGGRRQRLVVESMR